MAKPTASLEKIKDFWNSQINDEANWAFNMKLLRAVGLFGGSIFIMRNFGDLMAI
ncbi:mitochondrial import receptor subunit TOM5 homolog [Zingiber officinale]|uniref:mitochondrial import receptor subunit TOM5 homolog n=1 Tax=Zingiber officinale TaxID=94328 RepID=UPI001C4D2E88|nr:mitochondrial import receptor subunit TOM5 homolog [Zingiber officinale]